MKIRGTIIQEENAKEIMKKIGASKEGIKIMFPKTIFRLIKLENVRNSSATIIKQEMLSIGGDAAVHEKTTRCLVKTTDILLMGTLQHYKKFIKKMKYQPMKETKIIINEIKKFLNLKD